MSILHPFRAVEPLTTQLQTLCARLHADHIDVEAYVTSEHCVYVRPLTDLTDAERVQVIVAVRACCSAPVRWSEGPHLAEVAA